MTRGLNWPKDWKKGVLYEDAKKHKYGAKSDVYNGTKYRSRLEATKATELDWLKKSGEVKSWQYEPKPLWQIYVNGCHIVQYTIDFRVENADGTIDYIETKGVETRDFRIVWKLVKANFDELTEGENARLYLSKGDKMKLEKQSFKS